MEGDDAEYFFSSGDSYKGQFSMDRPHGKGEASYTATGSTYAGEFRDGLPNGQGRMTFSNGQFWEGVWKDGKRTGI
jgi:hypothetical protein